MATKSFVVTLKEYFGLKEGQTASSFMAEVKALTPQDKEDLYQALKAVGIDCLPPGQLSNR